jgi:hypothetical protein
VSIGNLTNQTKPNVQGRPSLTIQPIAARTLVKWLFLSSVYGKPGDAPKHLFMKCHFAKANQNYSWPLDDRANTSSLLPQNWEVWTPAYWTRTSPPLQWLLYLGHLAREEPSAYRLSRPSQDALLSAYHTDDGAKHLGLCWFKCLVCNSILIFFYPAGWSTRAEL